jgi:type I restriction enzyme S subunit
MGVKSGYKRTEVGHIPEGWEVTSIGQIAKIKTGPFGTLLKASEYSREGVPVVSVSEIRPGFLRITESTPRVSSMVTSRLPQYLLKAGDIVFGRKGGVDRSAPIRKEEGGWFLGSDGIAIRPDEKHSPEYLAFQFQTPRVKSWLLKNSTGTTMPSLNHGILSHVQIVIPDTIVEQQGIVEALSDAEVLTEFLEQLLAKKRNLKQGAMQELLTGKRRLPGFSGEWLVRPLGEIAKIKTGSRNNQDKVEDGDYPFYVRSATVERINSFSHDCEAILVPGEGGIGSIFHFISGRFDVHQRVYAITQFSSDVSGKYVYFFMLVNFGRHAMQNSVKATVDSLRLPTFQNFGVALPPTAAEQTAIAAVLSDMEAEITALEAKLTKARQLKLGMVQELLTGRIRLIRPSASVGPLTIEQDSGVKVSKSHSQQINEAVVISLLVSRFGSEQFPLGRFRRTKLAYLLHRHIERGVDGYLKKAAGPYNPSIRYGGAEKIALQNGYVREYNNGKFQGFVPGDRVAQAQAYFEKWYGADALGWLEQFRKKKNDELELLTTVDMASEDIRREGNAVNLSSVKLVLRTNPEWKAKLDRPIFADDQILAAIRLCDQLFANEERTV